MKEVPFAEVDRTWNTPEKAVLVSSVDESGRPNLIAVGWLMRAGMEPPIYAIGINQKSRSGENIAATGEFVIAVPGLDQARQLMYCGTHRGAEVDKFAATGLTALPARTVKAPLVAGCRANLECRVVAVQQLGDHRVFFGQVQACWASEEPGRPLLIVGPESGYLQVYEESGFRLGTVRE